MVDILTLFCASVSWSRAIPRAKATPPTPSPAIWTEYGSRGRPRFRARPLPRKLGLALWCEEHGLTAERQQRMTRAVLLEPNHALGTWGSSALSSTRAGGSGPNGVGPAIQSDGRLAAAARRVQRSRRQARPADRSRRSRGQKNRPQTRSWRNSRARTRNARRLAQEPYFELGLWCKQAASRRRSVGRQVHHGRAPSTPTMTKPGPPSATFIANRPLDVGRAGRERRGRDDGPASGQRSLQEPILKKYRSLLRDNALRLRAVAEARVTRVNDPRAVESVKLRLLWQGTPTTRRGRSGTSSGRSRPQSRRDWWRYWPVESRFCRNPRRARGRQVKTRLPQSDYVEMLVEMIHPPAVYWVQPVAGLKVEQDAGPRHAAVSPRAILRGPPPPVMPGYNFSGLYRL